MTRTQLQDLRKRTSASKRLLRSALSAAALGAGFLSLLAPAARAGGAVYQQHVVNAGVLVNDSNTQGSGPTSDPSPYLFYVLNNRTDVRPPDLTLVNPLAPTSITTAILNRWTPNVAGGKAPYTLGQSVTPDMAPYWEVPLNSVSDNELSQFNVLYLEADNIGFGPALNEKLRRFVDNGGQLIVEYVVTSAPPIGLFTGASAVTAPTVPTALTFPAVTTAVIAPPVVTQPYFLSGSDLVSLFNTIPVGQINYPPLALTANTADALHASEFTTVFSPALVEDSGSPTALALVGPAVSTAQIGAGQVIASALRIGRAVSPVNSASATSVEPSNVAYYLPQVNPQTTSPTTPPTVPRMPVPSDFYNVPSANPSLVRPIPAADLKLLTNMVELSETHPSENKTSHGNASGVGLASFSATWQYPVTGTVAAPTAPAAAVWGNFVFVTADDTPLAGGSPGTLHAFDAFPSENLTNALAAGSTNDDGLADFSTGTSYDEIWQASVGVGASAPTVASFNGVNYVFIESHTGAVAAFNAVTGAAGPTLTAPTSPSPAYPTGTNAPSPTVYEGRVYAGQSDGKLNVYDLNEGTSAAVTLAPPSGNNALVEPVVGPPAVGMITDGDTNVLVAAVSTPYNVYSVLAGGRNEPLKQFLVNNAINGYSIDRLGRYDINNIFADVAAVTPPLLPYDNGGNIVQNVAANPSPAPNPQDPLFSITTNFSYYTDWNMDFAAAAGNGTSPNPVNLNYVSATPYAVLNSSGPIQATMSPPVTDRHGDYYFTETAAATGGATAGTAGAVNSYLTGVTPAPLHNNVHLKFRFLIPQQPFTDAEGVVYNSLNGLHFVGSPVVDDQDNVYALATDATGTTAATRATVLCFRANQQVTATYYPNVTPTIDLTQATITQADEGGSGETNGILRGPDAGIGTTNATYGQFISTPTTLAFYNFGKRGRSPQEIAGDVTEPQTMTATDTTGTGNTAQLGFRTNLAWFVTPFKVNGNIAGLSQVGSSLFLSDGSTLYRIPTNPSVGTGKQVAALPFETPIGLGSSASASAAPGLGTLGAPPSIGGNVMVLNGTTGIEALTRQVTVIADSSRILGVDGDGAAVWSVDATTRTDPATAFATKVAFSHPTSLSQFAVNDYLAADTGSNRCVRFDSAGNVRWELTRFSDDMNHLMAPGQPLTLSQPSSVVVRTLPDTTPVSSTNAALVNPGGSFIFYLVADSGNNRIVEVEDRVDASGNIFVDPNAPNPTPTINHQLTWVTHTGDRDGRSYRYGSADYYTGSILVNNVPTPTLFVAATVVNTRLARLTATGLGPASGDAPGGSLVIFNRPQTPAAFSTVPAPKNDLVYTTGGFYAIPTAGSNPVPLAIRNPRFLKLYTPPITASGTAPNPNVAPFDFLYADDNGAFDLTFNSGGSGPQGFVAGADRLQFTAASYQTMNVPTSGVAAATYARGGLPFIPTSVQALSTDAQTQTGAGGTGGGTLTTRRYLITQSYSQGELGGPPNAAPKLGGEVFEVDVSAAGTSTSVTGAAQTPVGGFAGNETLSHPDLTGPLTQPTYAVRLP